MEGASNFEDNFSGVGEAVSLIGKGSRKTRRTESADSKLRLLFHFNLAITQSREMEW